MQLSLGQYPQACGMLGRCAPQFVVESNGDVYPCDFYALDEYRCGNIREDSLEELATCETSRAFLAEPRRACAACADCPFEGICHRNCKRLNAAYYALNQKYYGGGAVVDRLVENEWMRIPHFYRAFYVFVYATGFCAAMALSRRIMQEGESAVRDYRRFLCAGSSLPPLEALKLAGVDMTSPEPVRDALKIFQETIDQFRALKV